VKFEVKLHGNIGGVGDGSRNDGAGMQEGENVN
jgi:hypothetical protein